MCVVVYTYIYSVWLGCGVKTIDWRGGMDTYVYSVEDHHTNSCRQMDELWRQRELCDVNLLAENSAGKPVLSLPAHRVVLAANVPYFRAMLTSKMQESGQRDITLMNVDGEGLKRIVSFVYTGRLEITETTAQGILVTASLLGLPEIVSACERFMAKHLGTANCLDIAEFARLHNLEALAATAEKYSFKHFSSVCTKEEFLSLSVERVEELVSSNDITITAEEDVYEAVTRWIWHDLDSRKEHAERLYRHVRFPILANSFLDRVAGNNELLTALPAGKIMLQDARDYHQNPASAMYLDPKKIQPRSSLAGVLCVAGGTGDSGLSLSDVSYYNAHSKAWNAGTKMQLRRNRLSLVVFKGELYAIGGVEHMEPVSTVEKYSPLTNSWRYVASLNSPRRSCTALVAGFGIFVLGGFSGSVFLKSVEFYNAELDEWQYQQPMIHSRSELTGVFFDQRIYAIGGQNTAGLHRSVERFDFVNRKWESVADMCAARANAGAAMLGQEIFVSGGQTEKEVINMAEIYNPQLDQWEPITTRMSTPRVGLCTVSMGNMIYVIGGSNGSEYLDSVECYDPSQLKWVPVTSLPFPRFGAAAVLLSNSDYMVPLEDSSVDGPFSPPLSP